MAKQAVKSLVGWPSVMVVTAPCKHMKLTYSALLYLSFLNRAHSREMAAKNFVVICTTPLGSWKMRSHLEEGGGEAKSI